MVILLLTALFLTVVQLGFAVHVRNTLLDAATEGARFAALADSDLGAGIERTERLIETALGGGLNVHVSGSIDERYVEIRLQAPLPLLGFLGVERSLEVRGHAVRERLG